MAKFHDDVTKNIPNYPPYNIVKHDDDHFDIELAVAGFRKGDINVTVEKNQPPNTLNPKRFFHFLLAENYNMY